MRNLGKASISSRIILLIISSLVVTITALSIVSVKTNTGLLYRQMEQNGNQMAQMILQQIETENVTDVEVENILNDYLYDVSSIIGNMSQLTNESLEELVDRTNVSEINIINKIGTIILSNYQDNIGFVYPQEHAMQEVFQGRKEKLVEDIRKSMIDDKLYKYGGMKLPDGAIQVGISANVVNEMKKNINIQKKLEEITQSEHVVYALILDKEYKAIAHGEPDRIGMVFEDEGIRGAVEQGKEYAGVHHSKERGLEIYDVIIPLKNPDGEIAGAVNIGLSMAQVGIAAKNMLLRIILISVLIFVLMIAGTYLFTKKKITQPIEMLSSVINKTAKLELTKDRAMEFLTNSKDETGTMAVEIFNMRKSLKEIVENIEEQGNVLLDSAENLSKSTRETVVSIEQVAKTVEELASGAADQAQQATDSNQKLGDLNHKMNDLIENIHTMAQHADKTKDINQNSMALMVDLKENMKINQEMASKAVENVNNLSGKSSSIGEIVNVIQSIAEQTNMLALNAAIEAARAGEAGKGFAVVAEEVRKLAEQTTDSTNKIKEITSDIQKDIEAVKENMDGAQQVVNGTERAAFEVEGAFEETTASLNSIIREIERLTKDIELVKQHKDEVMFSIDNIAAITQQASAATEEVSATVEEQTSTMEEIEQMAENLKNIAISLEKKLNLFKL